MDVLHNSPDYLKLTPIKQKIIHLLINTDSYSLAELSKEINASIPTTTKIVVEMIEDGLLVDIGKAGTNSGRRPSMYSLNPAAGYIVGIDIRQNDMGVAIIDFKGKVIDYIDSQPIEIDNTAESFIRMTKIIKEGLAKRNIQESSVRAYGVNLSGRVNNETGYCFTHVLGDNRPIGSILEKEFSTKVFVENDSRAMAYGEYLYGENNKERHMLFFNVTWGLGMGMIIEGKLSYGRSGFSGEIGHFPMLDNNQICHCGKVGCLETGASGIAMHRIFIEKLKEGRNSLLSNQFNECGDVTMDDILEAIKKEDVLAIEVVEEIGSTLGRAIAGMINIFNPELIIIGGKVSEAGDYLLLPIKSVINKHSLNVINKDTTIKFSKLGRKAGPIGACMLSRSKFLGIL